MTLVCRNARNLSTSGVISASWGNQTSLYSLLEYSKTLIGEKKPWEASLSGWFRCGRSILAPQLKVTRRLARMHVQCDVVGRFTLVRWSQTSLNTPLKGCASSLCRVLLI